MSCGSRRRRVRRKHRDEVPALHNVDERAVYRDRRIRHENRRRKILLTRAGTYVDAATAGMGNVLLSGASDVTVTYLANDKVYVKDFHIPYSEEFAADGVEIGQKLSAEVVVKNARVVIAGIEGSNVIRVEVENEACVKAYDVTDEKS